MSQPPGRRLLVLDDHDFAAFDRRFDNLPYGVDLLAAHGYEPVHSDWAWSGSRGARAYGRLGRRVDDLCELPLRSVGAQLRAARAVELTLSIFEHQALAYERLRALLPMSLPPQVVMSCWLGAWSLTASGRRRHALRSLASRAAAITVFSANQAEQVAQLLDVPVHRVHVVPYGVDTRFYQPLADGDEDDGPPYVAAAGNDIGRDWPTFLRACAALPHVRFRIASQHAFGRLSVPANVELLGGVSHEEYRRLLQRSRCVVVPAHPLSYPSGQSVVLESYAMGKPVVCVRSAAMRDYAVEGASSSYEPGDADDLADAVRRTFDLSREERDERGALAREAAVRRFSNQTMWAAVATVLDTVLGRAA